jgi:small subunit ribosomal protein S9
MESNDNVNEQPEQPEEIASEDVAGGQETPSADALDSEQAIVDEPVAESERIAAEETPITGSPESAPTAEAGGDDDLEYIEEDATPRVKPAIPGMDLEVDIVREGEGLLGGDRPRYSEDEPDEEIESTDEEGEDELPQTIADASIDLAAGARYRATGKRKTAVARVTLKPGTGAYIINGKTLNEFFPRATLQRTIRQPLETVGYEDRMDVVASMHGGGVSAQAGALRHGVSKALLEADPNLRTELKRRGFLTRDARAKERKKAGLKKARKRPQFSKR